MSISESMTPCSAEPLISYEQICSDLPCLETVAHASISAGVGFAVGGFIGSFFALGSQFIVIPIADSVFSSLLDKSHQSFFISCPDGESNLGMSLAKSTFHCAALGFAAPEGALYGGVKGFTGMLCGQFAVNVVNNRMNSSGVKADSASRRVVNFTVGLVTSFGASSIVGWFMNSMVSVRQNNIVSYSNRHLLSIPDAFDVSGNDVCPSRDVVFVNSGQRYTGFFGECSIVCLNDTVGQFNFDRSSIKSALLRVGNNETVTLRDGAGEGLSLNIGSYGAVRARGASLKNATTNVSDNGVVSTYGTSARDSVMNLQDSGAIRCYSRSVSNAVVNMRGGSLDFFGSSGSKLEAFVSGGVVSVKSGDALADGVITLCHDGLLVNDVGQPIMSDVSYLFKINDYRSFSILFDDDCKLSVEVVAGLATSVIGVVVLSSIAAGVVGYVKRDALKSFVCYFYGKCRRNNDSLTVDQAAAGVLSLSSLAIVNPTFFLGQLGDDAHEAVSGKSIDARSDSSSRNNVYFTASGEAYVDIAPQLSYIPKVTNWLNSSNFMNSDHLPNAVIPKESVNDDSPSSVS